MHDAATPALPVIASQKAGASTGATAEILALATLLPELAVPPPTNTEIWPKFCENWQLKHGSTEHATSLLTLQIILIGSLP